MYYENYVKNILLIETLKRSLFYEAFLYLDDYEKEEIKNNSKIQEKLVEISILNFNNKKNICLISGIICFSYFFDKIKFKRLRYLKYLQNIVFRLLLSNTIFYFIFSDYNSFYKKIFYKYHKLN